QATSTWRWKHGGGWWAREAVPELPRGDREARSPGTAAGEGMAGPSLRSDPEVRRGDLGSEGVRRGGEPVHADVFGAEGARAGDGGRRHALRDGLDHARQHVGGRAVPRDRGESAASAR